MHYAIIGNSLLSVKVAEEIRKADQEAELSLFCPEGVLPYHRHLLTALLLDKKIHELACVPEDFYTTNRIKIVLDKKIAKVHPKRKRILTEDKEQIPFDVLVIEDGGAVVFPDIKGAQKQGVFHLKTSKDAEDLVAYLGLLEIAIVEVNNIVALQVAYHLRKLNKEVIAVVPSGHLLADLMDKDVADYLVEQLQKAGMRFIFNNEIVEILGDADVKAIRLKTGKVLESQFVFLSQADKSLDLLNTDDLSKEETDYCIKHEDVYCLKDLKKVLDRSLWEDFLINQYALEVQAKNIVATLLHQEPVVIAAPAERCFDLGDISVSLLGACKKEDNMTAYMKVDYKVNAYKKVFIQEGIVKGAALVNAQSDRVSLLNLIIEKVNVKDRGISIIDT
jgi:NAD(P)H-nitrite reductase large subunit